MKRKAKKKTRKTQARPQEISAGRTFADKDRPTRWYVVLQIDFVWSLVWWEAGVAKTIPLSYVRSGKVRITAFAFPMTQLLPRWGLTSKQLDSYLEQHMYRHDADVLNVRATRQPLSGKTLTVVRQRHRPPRV